MEIVEIDYFENDAILLTGDKRIFFQFKKEPSIEEALNYIVHNYVLVDPFTKKAL